VDDVVAYRTIPGAPAGSALDELRRGFDAITFTSPSTVYGFSEVGPEWRRLAEGAIVATIGPTTTAAAREAGLSVHEAEEKSDRRAGGGPRERALQKRQGDEAGRGGRLSERITTEERLVARGAGGGRGRARPQDEARRLRRTAGLRALVRETSLSADDLILPLFVCDGTGVREEIPSMPGVFRDSVDLVAERVQEAVEAGIRAVLLFGVPDVKDAVGSGSYDAEGAVQRSARMLRERFPDLVLVADTCMCEYTDHGHCGILDRRADVDNDATLEVLARIAVSQAESGADLVAPSGMIDGQVAAIRSALDGAGHAGVGIMSYSAKYASAFYGPFRDAAQGAPAFGDRRSHQMDPPNAGEAIREARQDLDEGADLIMVKPALAYLDVVRRLKEAFEGVPLVAYNVSGEYAMVKAAAAAGWLAERSVVLETLTSIKRAGADLVITYHALDAARWLK
jgi:porphobilinogen synthase